MADEQHAPEAHKEEPQQRSLAVPIPQFTDPVLRTRAEYAWVLTQSGFFSDARRLSQAIVKMLKGEELGLPPFAAMSEIFIVDGKASLSANLLASLVKRSERYRYRIVELTDASCVLRFDERVDGKWEMLGTSWFNIDDAKRAGLAGKDNWKKYPRAMLFARALSAGVKLHCPDVTGGSRVYVEDELEDAPADRPANFIDLPQPGDGSTDESEEQQHPAGSAYVDHTAVEQPSEPAAVEQDKGVLCDQSDCWEEATTTLDYNGGPYAACAEHASLPIGQFVAGVLRVEEMRRPTTIVEVCPDCGETLDDDACPSCSVPDDDDAASWDTYDTFKYEPEPQPQPEPLATPDQVMALRKLTAKLDPEEVAALWDEHKIPRSAGFADVTAKQAVAVISHLNNRNKKQRRAKASKG